MSVEYLYRCVPNSRGLNVQHLCPLHFTRGEEHRKPIRRKSIENSAIHLNICHYPLATYVSMQDKPHDDPTTEETSNDSDSSHNYNCQCPDCLNKYGSLPLLLQGIEARNRSSDEQPLNLTKPSTSTSGASASRRNLLKCTHCEKTFNHRGDLNKHLRMHSGEKPFKCDTCGRLFSHTSNLTRHLKVHTGDKPFDCELCGKSFSRKDKLELHKNTRLCKKRSLSREKTD